jgi:hypothetical protein
MRAMLEKWGRLVRRLHADVFDDLDGREVPDYLRRDLDGFVRSIRMAATHLTDARNAMDKADAIREQAERNLRDNPGTDA